MNKEKSIKISKEQGTKKISKDNKSILDKIFNPTEEKDHTPTEAENVSLIIKEWLNPDHITRKTRYTKRQVLAVSILQSLADTYDIKTLKRFLTEFRTNKLSEDGKSSIELENILKSRVPEMEESKLEKLSKYLE